MGENMGKVTFEFDSVEELYDVKAHANIHDFISAVDEAWNYCRNQLKHGDISDETDKHLERVRDLLTDAYNMSNGWG